MFQMSSFIIFAKEVARFGEVSYSFQVQCDANKQYYSCTLKKRNGETIIGSIDFPFEAMELLQISICNVSEYVSHVENWNSLLPISQAEQLRSIFRKSLQMNGLRMFFIAGLVGVEEHYIHIGVADTGLPEGPDYNNFKRFYCGLDTMEKFAKATNEAITVVDKFNLNQGNVRKRIELETATEDMIISSPFPNALLVELSPLNTTN